jgi:hypothetical protein
MLVVLSWLMLTSEHLGASVSHAQGKSTTAALKCQGEEQDSWLSEWRTIVEQDKLYLYAVKLFNLPVECEAKITETFNGAKFGTLLFAFAGGNVLSIETFPPEASRVTLKVPQGFPDEGEAHAALEHYTQHIGVNIDWSKPVERTDGEQQLKTFSAPEQGLNAGATMIYKHQKLIEIGLHMAL